ncbi:hypothetical protein TM239_03830 [Bradyrhizobium sp. TM239]|nr:hypothetical protein TM233_61190 [Bradyrhizobium sp. TM233]GMO93854.1 hypothetical protein TM239_03830 [Bradyrhizobium sp. TM239]
MRIGRSPRREFSALSASAHIFAVQYQRLANAVSGAVALGTLLAAVTLPLVVMMIVRLKVG